jgi:hypothetical protein
MACGMYVKHLSRKNIQNRGSFELNETFVRGTTTWVVSLSLTRSANMVDSLLTTSTSSDGLWMVLRLTSMLQGWPKVGPAKRDSFLGAAPTITVNYCLVADPVREVPHVLVVVLRGTGSSGNFAVFYSYCKGSRSTTHEPNCCHR